MEPSPKRGPLPEIEHSENNGAVCTEKAVKRGFREKGVSNLGTVPILDRSGGRHTRCHYQMRRRMYDV
eukprot:2292085-Rhodomonas_salina.1